MNDSILITGGSGKTGSRVASLLQQRGANVRIAGRTPRGQNSVRFDWLDAATYDDALEGVSAIYLVAPSNVTDALGAMRPLLDQAIGKGVEQFVLLSASIFEEGGPMMGAIHAYLKQNAPRWTALRPTWFMQNFSEQQHLATIRDEGAIYSATGDGRVPFIDASDIAAVAAQALLDPHFPNGDLVLTGPELLSYDQVAHILSEVVGKQVTHRRLSEEGLAERFVAQGMASDYAQVLASMDTAIGTGVEDRLTDEVERVTGCEPTDFQTFATRVREVWVK